MSDGRDSQEVERARLAPASVEGAGARVGAGDALRCEAAATVTQALRTFLNLTVRRQTEEALQDE
jgi:hypothetical protein